MSAIRRTLLAAAVLFSAVGTAGAADLNYGGKGGMKDGYLPPIANSPTLYIRGDMGWATYDKPDMWEDGIWKLSETKIDRNLVMGGGLGYYFSRNVRGDVTYEYRRSTDFEGNLADYSNDLPGKRKFGVQTNLVMANVYYDFNSGGRVMPYVGVGLGAAHHKVSEGTVDVLCGCPGTIDGAKNWTVAGAFMTGLSINILGGGHSAPMHGGSTKDAPVMVSTGRNLFLDVGYRFLHLGDTATGPVRGTGAHGLVSYDPSVESIRAHEFRVGLRYDLR